MALVSKWYKLLDVDPETEVPEVYSRYTPQPLPSSAKDPDGYFAHRLSLPQEEPVVPPVDNDIAEFIRAVKRPKILSDHPSQQSLPAHLSPTVPAPEDSFVLDEDGNLADGHGNNYVALDAEDCRQADPTWT